MGGTPDVEGALGLRRGGLLVVEVGGRRGRDQELERRLGHLWTRGVDAARVVDIVGDVEDEAGLGDVVADGLQVGRGGAVGEAGGFPPVTEHERPSGSFAERAGPDLVAGGVQWVDDCADAVAGFQVGDLADEGHGWGLSGSGVSEAVVGAVVSAASACLRTWSSRTTRAITAAIMTANNNPTPAAA